MLPSCKDETLAGKSSWPLAWISLPILVFLYKPLSKWLPRFDKDGYVRRIVATGNAFFKERFSRIPYRERMLFLPYCLRAKECPTTIAPDKGLLCPDDCDVDCRLMEMKKKALDLGYQAVHIVVSGKLHKKEGVLRSRDFLVRQIEQYKPRAVIGCLCTRDLREKYLCSKNLSPDGTLGKHGLKVIPQVALLKNCSCRQSDVEWECLDELIGLCSDKETMCK